MSSCFLLTSTCKKSRAHINASLNRNPPSPAPSTLKWIKKDHQFHSLDICNRLYNFFTKIASDHAFKTVKLGAILCLKTWQEQKMELWQWLSMKGVTGCAPGIKGRHQFVKGRRDGYEEENEKEHHELRKLPSIDLEEDVVQPVEIKSQEGARI
ncbi:hypothetical protein OIU74_026482 [Salix koriyanagi]|uniref:Uncharacterized protein n=1 Tax=Salix koriyanagi TaxID=2511006 RepID=A0A9Q1A441_9ROSI|nr:hypothetical protein OIU74_026482 [Salix koriyanagi]